MNKLFRLVRVNLNVDLGLSALRLAARRNKRKLLEMLGVALAFLVGIGSLMVVYSMFLKGLYQAGTMLGQPEVVLTMAYLGGQMMVFVFGIFYVISTFYFSEDLNLLVPLPLYPYQILGSKLINIMLYEYITLVPLLLPALVIYGQGKGVGVWLKGLGVILLSPVLPLTLATLIAVVLMRVVNLRKRKDLLTIVGGFLSIILILALNLFFNNRLGNMNQEQLMTFLTEGMGLINAIGRSFPPSIWATFAISQGGNAGLLYFLLLLGTSLGLFLFLLWLSNQIFFKGLLAGQEERRNKQKISKDEMTRRYQRQSSPVIALFWREWKLLMRTPVYVLNAMAGVIIGPLMILLTRFSGNSQDMEQVLKLLQGTGFYFVLGGALIITFINGINVVSSTAISREGSSFWISKMIPVAPRDQVRAKALHGLVVALMGIGTTLLTIFVTLPVSWLELLGMGALGFLGSAASVYIGLMIDVYRPKLEWTNPQQAVKQNLNVFFEMLALFLVLGAGFGLFRLLVLLGSSDAVIYGVFTVGLIALNLVLRSILYHLADRRYVQIEV